MSSDQKPWKSRHGMKSSELDAAKRVFPSLRSLFCAWLLVGGIASLQVHWLVAIPGRQEITRWISYVACYLPWTFFTAAIFRIESRFPLTRERWLRNLVALAGWSIPVSLVSSPVMFASYLLAVRVLRETHWWPHPWTMWFSEVLLGELLFWVSVAASHFQRTTLELRDHEQRAVQLKLEKFELEANLHRAQLDALRSRLNPHFLFNSLQNISMLTQEDPVMASRMLARLGDLLRAVLRHDLVNEHNLNEEINLTQKYTTLEQMRFGDRLQVDYKIDEAVQRALVPRFLLQPLVENAILHGLRGIDHDGHIKIKATREQGKLALMIVDNGTGLADSVVIPSKVGVGVGTTRERLKTMFPNNHSFSINCSPASGTTVRITIPLRFENDEDDAGEEKPCVC